MKKASLYKKLSDNQVKCLACNHQCLISDNKAGFCGVRQNKNGELYLMVYNYPAAVNIDPVEKKPLFHFYPGSLVFSLGTVGCNFSCDFCQNWDISQAPKSPDFIGRTLNLWGELWPPRKIINYCQNNQISIIAYTYNEPTIWIEYACEIMKLAKQEKIKNVWVSNGFMSAQSLELISPYLDAINIDLKSFREEFYTEICKGRLEPIKENIQKLWETGIWEEITTLVIPDLNDSDKELTSIAKFLADISSDLVWHISAFYPAYKMNHKSSTPHETLLRAYNIGRQAGLRYVYTGNIPNEELESTYCPNCGTKVIERWGIDLIENRLVGDKCQRCGYKIAGRFD